VKSQVFLGETGHQRRTPRPHGFTYRMFWLALDLDELAALSRSVRGFAYDRWAAASVRDRDYAGPGGGTLRGRIEGKLRDAGVTRPITRITLVTIPRLLGYVFNPVSFYVCRDADGGLAAFVAEVRNTFGEMHHYVALPMADADDPTRYRFAFPKEFYVSPFLDEGGRYELTLRVTEDRFDLTIDLRQRGDIAFSATMRGRGKPMTTRSLWGALARLPIFAATVMLRIHWHALLLRVVKRIVPHHKPAPRHRDTIPNARPSMWYGLRHRLVGWARGGRASDAPAASSSPANELH